MSAVTGDALLLALYQQHQAARSAWMAFDHESANWMKTNLSVYLSGANTAHSHREYAIREAICAVKADGLPGALIQLRMIMGSMMDGEPEDDYRRIHRRQLFEHATWSIHRVLARHAGDDVEPDVSGETDLHQDPFRADVKALVAEWREMLADVKCEPGIAA